MHWACLQDAYKARRTMPNAKLTQDYLAKLRPDQATYIWDTEMSGFGVYASPTGRKTFLAQFRLAGRSKRVTIGAYGKWTVELARKEARQILTAADRDVDLVAEREKAALDRTATLTVGEMIDLYILKHCHPPEVKDSTTQEYKALRRRRFGDIERRRCSDLTKPMLYDLHHGLRDRQREGNAAIVLFRAAWRFAQRYGALNENIADPSRDVKLYKRRKRTRRLSRDEIIRIGAATRELVAEGSVRQEAVDVIRVIILTGARSGEIKGLKKAWVDLLGRRLVLPDSKTGEKIIWIDDAAAGIIAENMARERRRRDGKIVETEYVFNGRLYGEPFSDIQKPWCRICQRAGVSSATIHDMRHSFLSLAESRGHSRKAAADQAGHASLTTTEGYLHSSESEIIALVTDVGATIADLLAADRDPAALAAAR